MKITSVRKNKYENIKDINFEIKLRFLAGIFKGKRFK